MNGRIDGTVHGAGVLSNFDLFERAGIDTLPYLEALGVTRGSLAAGARVDWDRFAEQIEAAIAKMGADRFRELCGQITRTGVEGRLALEGIRTQRAAFEAFASRVMPAVWPVMEVSLEDRGPGFLACRIRVPRHHRLPRDYLDCQGSAIAVVPAHAGLTPARLLDSHVDEDGRRLSRSSSSRTSTYASSPTIAARS